MTKQDLFKQASCEGKQQLSKSVAVKIAKRCMKSISPYHCKFCGYWHVGTNTGKVKDERRQRVDRKNSLD